MNDGGARAAIIKANQQLHRFFMGDAKYDACAACRQALGEPFAGDELPHPAAWLYRELPTSEVFTPEQVQQIEPGATYVVRYARPLPPPQYRAGLDLLKRIAEQTDARFLVEANDASITKMDAAGADAIAIVAAIEELRAEEGKVVEIIYQDPEAVSPELHAIDITDICDVDHYQDGVPPSQRFYGPTLLAALQAAVAAKKAKADG